jgi:DNA-binding transcriptional ArsR family regulator
MHRPSFALVATNAKFWTALGDPTRRKIFELLVDRPSSVSGLATVLPVTRPAVSQHLKVLKDAGLVADARSGKERIYRIDPDGLAAFRAEIDQFWVKTLAGYAKLVEQPREDNT